MHDIWLFADIWYDGIFQLIWPIINTDMYIFFPTPNPKDHQVSSIVEFTHSIIMHTLTVLAHQQM